MASENVTHVTDADFEETVIKSELPALVNFWAEWRAPYRSLFPLLDELADQFKDQVKIVKVNVNANSETAANYGIRDLPTLILFSNGEQKDMVTGAIPEKIRKMVAENAA